jgi:hypothetical protein
MKNVLKNHIAEGKPQKVFPYLDEKEVNIDLIKQRYNTTNSFEQKLIVEKKQYISSEYKEGMNQFEEDNRTLLNLIDQHF